MQRGKYIGTKLNIVMNVNEIFSIHYFEYVKHFFGIGESHYFWEMVYVDCGMVEVTADKEVFTLKQGEAYFHQPNEYHNIASMGDFASVFIISYSLSGVESDFFKSRRVSLDKREKEFIFLILEESSLAFEGAPDIMEQTQLIRSTNAPFGGEQVIKLLLENLLINIVRGRKEHVVDYIQKYTERDGNEQYIVESIKSMLECNIYGRLTLDEICRHVMFSKSYVEKIFRANTGCGVIKYFNLLKTNEAKRLISERTHSFTDIAEMLGFGSLHYFSRTFKLFVGMNPSEYEKSVRSRGLL